MTQASASSTTSRSCSESCAGGRRWRTSRPHAAAADATEAEERILTGTSSHATWKAPPNDGGILIWPDAGQIFRQTLENHHRLDGAESARIQNLPLDEVRRWARRSVGHDPQRPLILTGHQVELHHPGVWAKNALIDALAQRLGGAAMHVAIDTDAPKHLQLRWPGGGGSISDDPAAVTAWSGLLPLPAPSHLSSLENELRRSAEGWGFAPCAIEFLDSLRRQAHDEPNLPDAIVSSLHEIDTSLGLHHLPVLVSPLLSSPAYLALAHHILARPDSFRTAYNDALAEYRREEGIADPGRPWPDLRCDEQGCEAPFWFDCLRTGQRRRGRVARGRDRWLLRFGEGEAFVLDPARDGWEAAGALGRFLASRSLRLSTRALTLTMYLRLLLADQFVHGIGGGLYDRVTDRIIERWIGLSPPPFSVTTATLLFPLAAGQERLNLRAVREEGRRLRHRWADPEKRQLAREIASRPRRSQDRQRLFQRMHATLDEAVRGAEYRRWEQRYAEARRQWERQQVLFDRELFYALQPADRLAGLIGRYRDEMTRL